ncbi:MAG: DUF2089 domain-containing protein [Chloroflexi bacterium]|nr:DUF2089 domain-containing protein [Chloroflexota bacterium]
MDTERLRILKMLEEGKVSAEEAARLLDALRSSEAQPKAGAQPKGAAPRWLRIRVTDADGSRVNINLPVKLLDFGLRIAERFGVTLDSDGDTWGALKEALAHGDVGRIVEIKDAEDGDQVEIYLE